MRRALCVLLTGMLLSAGAVSASASGATKHECHTALTVSWKHGVARYDNGRGLTCARVKQVIRYALNHGLLAPAHTGHGFFVLSRRHMLGFTFTADSFDHTRFHARKRAARMTFNVCWLNVDC